MNLLFLTGFKVAVTSHELEVNRRDDGHFDGTEKPPKKVSLSVPVQAGIAEAVPDRDHGPLEQAGGHQARTADACCTSTGLSKKR